MLPGPVLGSVLSSRYVGVDSHQPTTSSEEIDFGEEQLPEPQPREAVAVETVEEEAAVSKEYGAGDHGLIWYFCGAFSRHWACCSTLKTLR